MIEVSVMYTKTDDATFDVEYYTTTHTEIVERTIKPSKWEIDSGMDGPYIAIGHLYFDSPEAMGAGLAESGEATADVSNFTNTETIFQISEVVT